MQFKYVIKTKEILYLQKKYSVFLHNHFCNKNGYFFLAIMINFYII